MRFRGAPRQTRLVRGWIEVTEARRAEAVPILREQALNVGIPHHVWHASVGEDACRVRNGAAHECKRVRALGLDVGLQQSSQSGHDLSLSPLPRGRGRGLQLRRWLGPRPFPPTLPNHSFCPTGQRGVDRGDEGVRMNHHRGGVRGIVERVGVRSHSDHACLMAIQRVEPGPGQESVWDYPRPPRLEPTPRHLVVSLAGITIAESSSAHRVLETSQPPAYYFDPADVRLDLLEPTTRRTFCEWKGQASYFDVVAEHTRADDAAWTYPSPTPAFAAIRDHLGFYAQLLDCFVDGEHVTGNEGTFYGGWITHDVVGPFKGGAGTAHW